MLKRLACAALLLVLALVLGVTSAGGRSLAVSTVTVQVTGYGTVTSDPAGIKCGNTNTTCSLAFSGGSSATVTLTATAATGWAFDSWSGACTGGGTCTIPVDGSPADVTANFVGLAAPAPTTLSTLSVSTSGTGTVKLADGAQVAGQVISCGSGSTDVDCSKTFPSGSTLTLLQEAGAGQVFVGWGGACTGTNPTCTVFLKDNRQVSATWVSSTGVLLTVNLSGSGTVTGGGISCPGSCTATEAVNSSVVLTATPADGQIFSGWSGACTGTAPSCTVTMDEAKTATATFAPVFPLSVSVNGNGNVSGEGGSINCGNGASVCSASFALNKTVTLTASAATGATFLGWSGACGNITTTCTILMSAAKSVTASFSGGTTASSTLTVAVTGNGRVTGSGISCGNGASACTANVATGSSVTLSEAPASGATFSGWGGACSGAAATCTVSMTGPKTVTATFASGTGPPTTVPVSVSVSGRGKVTGGPISCGNGSSACNASLAAGSKLTLTAAPASGASFLRWGGACSGTVRTCTLTVNAATSVTATFSGGTAPPPGTLSINVTGKGSVRSGAGTCTGTGAPKTCTQKLPAAKTLTLRATPAAGFRFGGWSGACTGTKATCTISTSGGKEVGASFVALAPGALERLGSPVVRHAAHGFTVTLRFSTAAAGTARVTAIRAGRSVLVLPLHVGAGPVTIGPFAIRKPGLYRFQVRLGSASIAWRACLGRCFVRAPGAFVLRGEVPESSRSGDAWSVTLRLRANLISDGRLRVLRDGKLLVRKRVLAPAGAFTVGPFLFGPGSYTVRFTATDAYGRVRTLSWVVALAR